ncbi:AzlC family ABC transporter permease [Synergistaceae bacterium OttesenSCG-928-I11]|nr:AzlC family ABC transporter permease [Synergistaceae bacterium OttesenSCG-928-I11]
MNDTEWRQGLRDGVPIALGYFAVSFSFGIVARNAGLTACQAGIMSATNMTSAGQFAALGLIGTSAGFLLMALTQLVINMRYALMSAALSQKLPPGTSTLHRLLLAYCVTDEIFGLSALRPGRLDPHYTYGLMVVAVPGWTLGTIAGVVSGDLLPERLLSALGIAIYGMFIAVVVPPARHNRRIAAVVVVSMAASLIAAHLPFLNGVSDGAKVIGLTLLIAAGAAFLDPHAGESDEKS